MDNPCGHWFWVLLDVRFQIPLRVLSGFRVPPGLLDSAHRGSVPLSGLFMANTELFIWWLLTHEVISIILVGWTDTCVTSSLIPRYTMVHQIHMLPSVGFRTFLELSPDGSQMTVIHCATWIQCFPFVGQHDFTLTLMRV